MVRATLPSRFSYSLTLSLAGVALVTVLGCVSSGEKASDDRPSQAASSRNAELTDPRGDVRVSLPSEARTPPTSRPVDPVRDETDAPPDVGTLAGIQAELAQSAGELQTRLEAAVRKEAAAKRSQPEPERTLAAREPASPPASPTASPPATSSAALPSDPKALAQAIVNGLKSGATKDSGPVVAALLAASNALEHPDAPFDVNAYTGLSADDRELVMRFRESCVAIGRDARGNAATAPTTAAATTSATPAVTPAPATPSAAPAAQPSKKPLAIPRFDLATRVDGYGKLTPVSDRRFLPGKPTQVILYVEVAEFDSERDERAGEWLTTLASKVAIFAKHDGTEVWTRDWQAVTDRSAVKRSEFFICEKVTLSEYLTVGTYVMKASVRDEKTGAVAEKSLEFQVVADPSLAAK